MSDDVRRYTFTRPEVVSDDTGSWVRSEDYDRLRAELAEAKEDLRIAIDGQAEHAKRIAESEAAAKILGESNYELCEKIIEKNRCIEELEAEHNKQVCLRCMHAPGHFVTEEQINDAWEFSEECYARGEENARFALGELGIVACENCEGYGQFLKGNGDGTSGMVTCPDCHRNGKSHGWVVEER